MNRARARRHPAFGKVPQVSHPACGAAIRAESDPIFPRTGRAHELARGEHDTRIDFAHLRVTESEFFHRAGGAVLDDYVGDGDEPFDDPESALAPQVDAQAALASARRGEGRIHFRAVNRADEIGMGTRLDFDHVCAVFRQQPARFDADTADSEVQYAQAGEWISPLRSVGERRGFRDGCKRLAITFTNGGGAAGETEPASVEDEDAVTGSAPHPVFPPRF